MTGSTEREKFFYLLQLCQEQIRALEGDDYFAFDRILSAKGTLITTMTEARATLAADPSLGTVVARIQECDRGAQRLLYRKVGAIMRELSLIQSGSKARAAYGSALRRRAVPVSAPPNAPVFMDKLG